MFPLLALICMGNTVYEATFFLTNFFLENSKALEIYHFRKNNAKTPAIWQNNNYFTINVQPIMSNYKINHKTNNLNCNK